MPPHRPPPFSHTPMRGASAVLPHSLFRRALPPSLHHARTFLTPHSLRPNIKRLGRMTPSRPSSSSPAPPPPPAPAPVWTARSRRASKKALAEAPEFILRYRLDQCSKHGDLPEALRLYDAAVADDVPLSAPHFNALLYLCASHPHPLGLARYPAIHRHMSLSSISPNEATFTSLARLAAASNDPDAAFSLVQQMSAAGIPPKLRSYGPALSLYCRVGNSSKAREVESHMSSFNIALEEPELAALLKVHCMTGESEQVYRLMQRMRGTLRQVMEGTAEIIEGWFETAAAAGAGVEEWDVGKVREGVVKGGGGCHGQGWLGMGRWNVGRSEMDKDGVCRRCGEKLVCIDIDPRETEEFARKLAKLACERQVKGDFKRFQVKGDFKRFQEWLEINGPFDAVIDGANVGLRNQSNLSANVGLHNQSYLNFFQLKSVVNGISQLSPSKKLPLVILHTRHVIGDSAENPTTRKLLESWHRSGALYPTPVGSNDDWYWLYAAVSCRSLLVTNDEMRDHLFQLLGTSFFPRWKEKHQVRLTFSNGPHFHMPPPYSNVIQESEGGSWHVPTVTGDDIETPRQWVCATRDATAASSLPHAQLGHMKL